MFRRYISLAALVLVGLSNFVERAEAVKFEMTAKAYPETSELAVFCAGRSGLDPGR